MSRLRIVHAIFSSRLAGSERYCADLANRQAALGHEVHVVGASGSPLGGALSSRVRYHELGRMLRGLRLRSWINRVAPDVCHGHLSAACKALAGLSHRHHTVATLHVGYKPHQHARLGGLICVNGAQARRLGDYQGQVRTIPNWLPQPTPSSAPFGIRAELGLGKDVFLVGAVGRLHASKGMDVLVSAFRASAPAQAALVILGEGPQRGELERLCRGDDRIHLLGYRPAVHDCLKDLDLFVSPSREESFGLAIIEAMSTGVPIIATAAEGPGEFLLDQPVTLVKPGSVNDLSAGITATYAQYQLGRLPHIGYDLSLFDPAARVANIIDFYGQVIASRQWSPVRPVAVAT